MPRVAVAAGADIEDLTRLDIRVGLQQVGWGDQSASPLSR